MADKKRRKRRKINNSLSYSMGLGICLMYVDLRNVIMIFLWCQIEYIGKYERQWIRQKDETERTVKAMG